MVGASGILAPMRVDVARVGGAGEALSLPEYLTAGSAGADVVAAVDDHVAIPSSEWRTIPTGLALSIPEGYEAQIRSRSGLALRHGVVVLNSPGTVDSDFRGEVTVILHNHGPATFVVTRGMRIAQIVVSPVVTAVFHEVDILDATLRGEGGMGHTGE